MSKCKIFLTLVVGLLFSLPAMAYSPPGNTNTQHTTKIELKPASVIDMSRAYKTAAVCFLGVGDCDNEISYGKGGDGEDYTIDTAAQCKNEGFILNNCNSVQVPEGYCPYNKSYITRCKCASNLVTCPAGQVGVGESCGGKYTQCTCPTGVSAGAYGCEEYYPAPCNTVCKKAYADNCQNRTAASCPYGCKSYFADCSSKCQTCKSCNYSSECLNYTLSSSSSCSNGSLSCTACGITKYRCKPSLSIDGTSCPLNGWTNCNGRRCCCQSGESCSGPRYCLCQASGNDLIAP